MKVKLTYWNGNLVAQLTGEYKGETNGYTVIDNFHIRSDLILPNGFETIPEKPASYENSSQVNAGEQADGQRPDSPAPGQAHKEGIDT